MFDAKEQAIRNLGLFHECSEAEIRWIARIADEIDLPAGRVLGYAGSACREFVVVIDGVCSVGDVLLGRGAFYGEAELFESRRRTATISTLTDVRLLVFGVRAFRALVDRIPSVARRLIPAAHIDQDDRSLRAVS
jgi:CRP-like cAMP-binding protein